MARLSFSSIAFRPRLLLLAWDVGGLSGVVVEHGREGDWSSSAPVRSGITEFAHALDDVLSHLRQQGERLPKKCLLASRLVVPAVIDLPVDPEAPRAAAQMRELVQAEIESAVAEFGALWSIGAVLAARGLIDSGRREQVVLELAVRREQSSTPVLFGNVAVDLGVLLRKQLDEALHQQESLQMLESELACGWVGHLGEAGQAPVWLAAATGLTNWRAWDDACRNRGLQLLGAAPLAWLASEAPAETENRIAIEIHAEDVVAVLRHRGKVAAARSEGRLERPLAADWLARLIDDWRARGIQDIEIVCLDQRDEAALTEQIEQFAHRFGHPPVLRDHASTWKHLFGRLTTMTHHATPLPVVRQGRPRRPAWRRQEFWQLAAPAIVLLLLIGLETQQRLRIRHLAAQYESVQSVARRNDELEQKTAQFNKEMQEIATNLDRSRQRLATLLTEVDRRQSIENMGSRLPRLLRILGSGVGDDVVLEAVNNAQTGGDFGRIRVVGWSPDYARAQAFALRVQDLVAGELGYGVAQTDVSAAAGRTGKSGYKVSFWLVPTGDELDPGTQPPASGGRP